MKLDNKLGLNHQIRVCEGIVLDVNCNTNNMLRCMAVDREYKEKKMKRFEYMMAILEIFVDAEGLNKLLALEPPPIVLAMVLDVVKAMVNEVNSPEFYMEESDEDNKKKD